ncbi:hypothetical protein [Streptomyces radiopugnans]|uniref:Uncharacterized protein n=1 Tax=Streptomyces radiopugnans TaxID=403935 RepID=A0A1H9A441_9ACTN|nr:hypothetical protein [Streptomyces radiopugnans]SEP71496.1 hypothetical protein SAMN05216481_101875 [Streptomyces radiopugnans]
MTGDDRPTVPPVRLPAEAELARDALASPLLSRAARLARWAGEGIRVGAGGELSDESLALAAAHLGLDGEEDGLAHAERAWDAALDTGLLEIREDDGHGGSDADDAGSGGDGEDGGEGTAVPGEELSLLTGGAPADVLDIWRDGLEAALADAAAPALEDLLGEPGADGEDGRFDPGSLDLDALDWDPEEEADFLDGALGNLYVLTATDPAVTAGAMVPLPVLAASMVAPEDMENPTDSVLEDVSVAMVRLDEQFRMLEPAGIVDYRPVDAALIEEADGGEPGEPAGLDEPDGPAVPDEEDVARYGMVRLTPLGLYGVRQRLLEAGVHAPVVGDLAEEGAEALLAALPGHGEEAARHEIELWLARRAPLEAARELLAAARGDDRDAPRRRLACQQALSLTGAEAEPALREILDDGHLGGLARVWLSERGFADVPAPSEEMVFWLTVDTLAAQLATEGDGGGSEELRELVRGLVDQHSGFFDKAWRVDHPATGEVLEAMSRVHPDRKAAKDARKAAYRARSRG